MSQVSLFDRPIATLPGKDPWRELRWFQREACEATLAGFEENRSQLIVMATGCGKTQTFGAITRNWPGNVLIMAHREELVEQARARIAQMTGEFVEVEQADLRATRKARIVVASVQTIQQQHRLDRFGKDHFGLVIFDEAHHAIADSFRRPLDFFSGAKVLGVTATPDRGDEKALGKVFDSVSYVFDILQGIDQGYLVPLRGHQVELGEIQLDGIKVVAGDLAKGQLDEVMVRAVEGIVRKTMELEPHRQGVAFFPGVKSAAYAAERFNYLMPGSAAFISAASEDADRRKAVGDFRAGRIKYLCNCMIATEGFDAPTASLVIQARPTKSRGLYAQMAGRGTRVLPGCVEHIEGREGAEARRAAIAASAKPDCVIMDFVGNATKHALMTPEDLLGGDYSDEEVALAKKKAKEAPGSVSTLKALQEAREELARVAAAVRARVSAKVSSFNPFAVLNVALDSTTRDDMRWGRKPPSERQLEALVRMKVPEAVIKKMTSREASKLLEERKRRHDAGLATYAQLAQLKRFGLEDSSVTFEKARLALDYCGKQGWKPERVDIHRILDIVTGRKTA